MASSTLLANFAPLCGRSSPSSCQSGKDFPNLIIDEGGRDSDNAISGVWTLLLTFLISLAVGPRFGELCDMQNAFSISRIIASICCVGSLLTFASPLPAQEQQPLGAIRNHDHAPIIVQSRPVIERLPVKVIEPVDLRIGKTGHIFVADKGAKCVFRLDGDGEVSLPVSELSHIQRIQLDADDNLYVLTSDTRESQIQMVNPIGQSTVVRELTFAATSFVRDTIGQFVVASREGNRIVVITTDGDVTELTRTYQPVSDLVLNAGGQTEALLVSGEMVHIAASGEVTPSGFAPPGSSRLMLQPDGSMLVLAGRSDGQTRLTSVSRDRVRPQDFQTFASVPDGTQAVGFDALGNLCLANPDLRAITKVTSHFRIPCPHCGRPTDMIFRKDAEPAANAGSRSF